MAPIGGFANPVFLSMWLRKPCYRLCVASQALFLSPRGFPNAVVVSTCLRKPCCRFYVPAKTLLSSSHGFANPVVVSVWLRKLLTLSPHGFPNPVVVSMWLRQPCPLFHYSAGPPRVAPLMAKLTHIANSRIPLEEDLKKFARCLGRPSLGYCRILGIEGVSRGVIRGHVLVPWGLMSAS